MKNVLTILNKAVIATIVALFALVPSLTALVSADSSSQTCTPPPAQVGVNRPVGADAGTYTYDCTNGLWENGYYAFDPSTGLTTPTYSITYTYDPSTTLYDYPDWIYDAPSNSYVEQTMTTSTPPAGADVIGAPAPVVPDNSGANTSPGSDSITNTGPDSNNTITGNGSGSINNTGPDSNNTIDGNSSLNLGANDNNNVTINNTVAQAASSGDTIVIGNTSAGDATSGNTTDTANVINMLQSASDALGGDPVTFVANINGDVNGNLLLDPSTLGSIQPTATGTPGSSNDTVTVNNTTNAAINNNLNLAAQSGNSTVSNNTTGGNATTGSAEAIANVVNLIDSTISSGKSFIGEININGDFNGNIEIPANLINQLIASNVPTETISDTGPSSNNSIDPNPTTNNTTVNNTNNQGINNIVNANSSSGSAAVTNNTSAGNATSGSATNTITAFNLTGSSVVGSNDLLVFVNVSGTWVGMIINAPAGATAAELGGGITQASQNTGSTNTTINNNNNDTINNNITTNAKTGNALVSSNTSAGNATSGNASSAVNLLNVENTNLSLSGWFGILFINVFGTWNGSFGPTNAFAALYDNPANYPSQTNNNNKVSTNMAVFKFSPNTVKSNNSGPTTYASSTGNTGGSSINARLIDAHSTPKVLSTIAPNPKLQSAPKRNLIIPIVSIGLFLTYFIFDRVYTIRSRA